MAYDYRYLNRPEYTGYLVKQFNKCGKPNCRCAKDGKGHEANYVYYREYSPSPKAGTRTGFKSKLRKIYIKKSEVKKWQRKINLHKAPYVYMKLPLGALENKDLSNLKGNKLLLAAYEKYRIKRTKDAKSRSTDEETVKTRGHLKEARNRYQRLRHEFSLIKKIIKAQKRLEHPYNTKARSIAAIKGMIKRRQRYNANKRFVWA